MINLGDGNYILSILTLNDFKFIPLADEFGENYTNLTFRVCDYKDTCSKDNYTIMFNVTDVNDAPVVIPDSIYHMQLFSQLSIQLDDIVYDILSNDEDLNWEIIDDGSELLTSVTLDQRVLKISTLETDSPFSTIIKLKVDDGELETLVDINVNVVVSTVPILNSISINSPVVGNDIVKITSEFYDLNDFIVDLMCASDLDPKTLPECVASSDVSSLECDYTIPKESGTHQLNCVVFNGIDYSDIISTNYDVTSFIENLQISPLNVYTDIILTADYVLEDYELNSNVLKTDNSIINWYLEGSTEPISIGNSLDSNLFNKGDELYFNVTPCSDVCGPEVSSPIIIVKNSMPKITSIPSLLVNEDSVYSYTITASDKDNDGLIFDVVEKPDWLSFDSNTQILSGMPLQENVYDYNIKLNVSDEEKVVEQEFTITVNNVNDAPTITSEPIISVYEDQSYSYVLVVVDEDQDPLTFNFEMPSWLSFDSDTKTLSGTPTQNDVGNNEVKVIVTDGKETFEQEFIIVVSNINDAPDVELTSPIQGDHNLWNSVLVEWSSSDEEEDELTFELEYFDSSWHTITLDASNNWILPDYNGLVTLRVTAYDGTSETSYSIEIELENSCSCNSCEQCSDKLTRSADFGCSEIILSEDFDIIDNCISDVDKPIIRNLDCNNKIVSGSGEELFYSITNSNDLEIKNCNIENVKRAFLMNNINNIVLNNNSINEVYQSAVLIKNSQLINISDNEISNAQGNSITLMNVQNLELHDNYIHNNSIGVGLFTGVTNANLNSNVILNNNIGLMFSESSNNLIYNNLFNNYIDVDSSYSNNDWNVSVEDKTNIMMGTKIAGNYWAGLNCYNPDENEFCDGIYKIDANNIDSFPLVSVSDQFCLDSTQLSSVQRSGWQSFTSGYTGNLYRIDVQIYHEVDATISIIELNSEKGYPTIFSQFIPSSRTGSGLKTINLNSLVPLTSNQIYKFTISYDESKGFSYVKPGTYVGGRADYDKYDYDTDFRFATYMTSS